jgi:autotransporter-associated beta strand protein
LATVTLTNAITLAAPVAPATPATSATPNPVATKVAAPSQAAAAALATPAISLILDTPAATTLTLAGTLAGPGALAKTGGGILVLNGTAALGHAATRIDDGLVALRGISSAEAPSLAHTFALNGGWLDLSDAAYDPSGATANDWASLTFLSGAGAGGGGSGSGGGATTGGIIGSNDKITLGTGDHAFDIGSTTLAGPGGAVTGTGLFVVIDAGPGGLATLSGVNAYAGHTLLRSGTLRVTTDAALGLAALNREIIFAAPAAASGSGTGGSGGGSGGDGGTGGGTAAPVLELGDGFTTTRPIELRTDGEIAVAAAGGAATLAGAITATGTGLTLTKTGAGALVLTNTLAPAAPAQRPAVAIAGGAIRAEAAALNTLARVDIGPAGALTIAQLTAATLGATAITGPGALEKRGPATLTLAAPLAHTGPTRVLEGTLLAGAANVFSASSAHAVAAGATLDLGGFNQTVAALDLAAGATVILDAAANPAAGLINAANELTVAGALTGSGTLYLRLDLAGAGATGATERTAVRAGAGTDTSALKIALSERLTDGIYDLAASLDATGGLVLKIDMVSPEIPAGCVVPAISLLMGRAGLETAAARIGDLRAGAARIDSIWARGIYNEERVTGGFFDSARARARGIQAGADHLFTDLWDGAGATLVGGFFFDTINADSRPVPGADLDGRQRSLGLYGTLNHGAWFAGAIARYSRTTYTVNAPGDRLRVQGHGHALTLDAGRTLALAGAGRIEPSVSLVFQRQTFDDSGDRFVRAYAFGSTASLQLLGGVRWSTSIPFDQKSVLIPWLRAAGGVETDARQRIGIAGSGGQKTYWFENDLGGGVFTLEGGATFHLGERAALYGSAHWTGGGSVDAAGLTAGLRYSW